MIAPSAEKMISETIPLPRWMPSRGNRNVAMNAPTMPTKRMTRMLSSIGP
jgi:hypothetical protein